MEMRGKHSCSFAVPPCPHALSHGSGEKRMSNRKRTTALLAVGLFSLAFSFAVPSPIVFGFNHRVGASSAPYIVIHAPNGDPLPAGEDGTSVAFSSDGTAFSDVAVIGVRYEEAVRLQSLKLTFSAFANSSGSTCPYIITLRDPHGDKPLLTQSNITGPGTVTVYQNGYNLVQYLTAESFYTDDLVLLSMKANTTRLAAEANKTESVYTLSVIIEAVFP